MSIPIFEGDVAVRAGLVQASGVGYNALPSLIREEYNHAGIAISPSQIHHVESNGYETVDVSTFFSKVNAAGGAILRFVGPYELTIRSRVAHIARAGTYPKRLGNPFSTSENLDTVNCNEFIHELYLQAIKELMDESRVSNPPMFLGLIAAYTGEGGKLKSLIEARDVEFMTGGLAGAPLAAKIAEKVGQTQASHPQVKIKYEGKIEMRNLFPEEYAKSWNPLKVKLYADSFYNVAVLRTFTPNSFINSKLFKLSDKVSPQP